MKTFRDFNKEKKPNQEEKQDLMGLALLLIVIAIGLFLFFGIALMILPIFIKQ